MSKEVFYVSWDPPLSPNGVLTAYGVVVTPLINSQEVHMDMVAAKVTELSITSAIRKFKGTKVLSRIVYAPHMYVALIVDCIDDTL